MGPKDFINKNYNYLSSIKMDNERADDSEVDLKIIQRSASMDSLEQNEPIVRNLHVVGGSHKWMNTNNNNARVEKTSIADDNEDSIDQRTYSIANKNHTEIEEDENLSISSQTDLSLNHYDVQLQVNNGQPERAVRYGVFSTQLPRDQNTYKINQHSQTIEPEMDMDSRDGDRDRNNNGYLRQNNGNTHSNNNSDGSSRRNQRTNGSSGSGSDGNADRNGSNPNRNNNNGRKPNDDDDGSEDNEDDDDENETDESLARRLGFRPIDNETIRTLGRLRRLTNKQSFDRRDFENVQYLIDELIRLQHLENSSEEQLQKIINRLKLHRVLRTKSHALQFIQDRLPQRIVRPSNETSSNVFDIWRERERRARLDSKDSLEEEGQSSNRHQSRENLDANPSTSPVTNSNNKSKVKQMAENIDTRSDSFHTGDRVRSSSPPRINRHQPSDRLNSEVFIDDRTRTKRNVSPISTTAEQRRVRQMVNRLESSAADAKVTKKISTSKPFDDDQIIGPIGSTSLPSVKRVARTENQEYCLTTNGNNDDGAFVFRHKSPHEEIYVRDSRSNVTKFELDRDQIRNSARRATSGTNMDDFVTSLLPGTETSISMVRDVRARFYDDDSSLSRSNQNNVPVKVDVETLYILEQKSEKKSLTSNTKIHLPDYEYNRSKDRQDFGSQTTMPTIVIKPSNRPIGTQVDSTIVQSTVGAQTSDSLHRPTKERQCLPSVHIDNDADADVDDDDDVEKGNEVIRKIKTTTTTRKYEVKRRHSSHHTSEDEDNSGTTTTIVYTDNNDNFQTTDKQIKDVAEQRSSHEETTTQLRQDPIRDPNRNVVRRPIEQNDYDKDEYYSSEVYEIHTRGACKCLVVSYEEKIQYGPQTRFEKQLQRIERTYTEEELRVTELHVIVTSSKEHYELVRRDYGSNMYNDDDDSVCDPPRNPAITIHYYTKDGNRVRTEQMRNLEHLPLFIRCEIEYELNHYGSAQLIVLSITDAERRQMNVSIKKETVDATMVRINGRLAPKSPELEKEISRKLSEPISLLHLVDYSSRDDYNQTNSTDLRHVSRVDVSTSLRIVQRYRTVIHRLCQLYRSHLHLTTQAEQQRYLVLVARTEYYLLDLAAQKSNIMPKYDTQQGHQETYKQEVHHVPQQPFDYAKYRREIEQQQRILDQHYRKIQNVQTPTRQTSEAEFYLGAGRRALIEKEIHSMRESIRPHEHAPPRYKHEPARRSLSISYSGGQRYVRARIIHVKDFYDTKQQEQQQQQQQQQVKEQELFVRVDDFINESAANTLRRSYSTDYLQEDGPRSRIHYVRIPGETIRIEEKTTYEYQGVMYANLPYSLKYWNILYILDREAREGHPLGSSLPHVIVNDPYRTVIPPLTQQEIRQTAQQVLASQYPARSYTDQTLRWFLSRDKRTEIESAKYLETLKNYRQQQQQFDQQYNQGQSQQQQTQHQYQQQQQQQQHHQSNISVHGGGQQAVKNKYYVTETLVHYEKMPDRFIPVTVNDRAQSIDNLNHRSPSTSRVAQQYFHSQDQLNRSQSQQRQQFQPQLSTFTPNTRARLSSMNTPLSRHQSVHELHAAPTLSHPPSPSPSLHSLHSNHQAQNHRRPVAFNNHFQVRTTPAQQQNALLTEIIDSQTGKRILTTSQEQLPTEVLGLLNKYNLQQF
ncbi:unnamed protein product [Rotaria magnacalcarata]|uniref:Uncharacterized protein n=3 Tax=Rotaria magnacalcarata TaxID=392030 RepID=A0A814GAH5_9BILA|nr:unnamed protein product [Rotaria magnacalcarata]